MAKLLIYGCYGYTGKLISQLAAAQKMDVILAGRDAEKTRQTADPLQLPYRIFSLEKEEEILAALAGIHTVLHCAGPFKYTALPMAKACIVAGINYLDITGEIEVFETIKRIAQYSSALLIPGVGFDVVPSDCMALHLKNRMADASSLELILMTVGGRLSHGTAITVVENLGAGSARRENGKIIVTPSGKNVKEFDFGFAKKMAVEIPWGDVSTAHFTTGIPNITVYNVLPKSVVSSMQWSNYLGFVLKQRWVKNILIRNIKKQPAGPDHKMHETAKVYVLGIAKNNSQQVQSLLTLPEGYWLTAQTAIAIAQKILRGETTLRGYQTPASVFGADFILSIEKTERKDW